MTSAGTTRYRLNSRAMGALSLLLVILPLILGGNRPMAWTLYALLLSVLAAWYFASMARHDIEPRIGVFELPVATVLLCLFCCYILLQALPFLKAEADAAFPRSSRTTPAWLAAQAP